jgi:hypothetical protein
MAYTRYRFCPKTGSFLVEVVIVGTLATYLAGQALDLYHEGYVRPETHAEQQFAYHAPDGITASIRISSFRAAGPAPIAGGGESSAWDTASWNVGSWS